MNISLKPHKVSPATDCWPVVEHRLPGQPHLLTVISRHDTGKQVVVLVLSSHYSNTSHHQASLSKPWYNDKFLAPYISQPANQPRHTNNHLINTDAVKCQRICPLIYQPVCGSNGRTYNNKCHFDKEKCAEDSEIEILHNGECTGPKPLPIEPVVFEEDCPDGKCTHEYDPVCGTGNNLMWKNDPERII